MLISREDAKSAGRTRFFTGVECFREHLCERMVSNGLCVECQRIAKAKDRALNADREKRRKTRYLGGLDPEVKRERARALYVKSLAKGKRNSAKASINFKRWKANNLAAVRKWNFEYRKANREQFRAYERNRRALESQAAGKHTAEDIRQLYQLQKGRCAACKCAVPFKNKHIDHIIPLSAGGRNDVPNLQILCAPCNLSKGAKDPLVWAQELGRLL